MTTSFNIFGPVVTTHTVEKGVIEVAKAWLPTYINVVANSLGINAGSIAYPNDFKTSYDFDNYDETNTPVFVVVCEGTTGELVRGDGGEIGAWFGFQAGVLVADQTEESTRQVASVYASAIAMLLEQRGSLGGLSDETIALKIDTRLPVKENRTLALGQTNAETFVSRIMDADAGAPSGADPSGFIPGLPEDGAFLDPTTPYPDWQTAETVQVTVTNES
jgi:hypothetical protein